MTIRKPLTAAEFNRRARPATILILLLSLAVAGCGGHDTSATPPVVDGLEAEDPESWVRIYDPERAWGGYTLAFYKRRVPILMDMNGRIVHSWPEVRAKSRLRLLPDGSLLTVALGRAVVEYDWEGNRTWEHRLENRFPHHDVVRLVNGNTLLLVLERVRGTDELLEVDREGNLVWSWDSADHLVGYSTERAKKTRQFSHINSVQELPDNPIHAGGDERFRPGNLLMSARNLSTIFVVDRQSGAVVWSYSGSLDYQHEAYMIPPGQPGHGRILIFDNGFHDPRPLRQSRVLEIDPITAEVTWSYSADDFYSSIGGVEQPLPNGNVLIASSRGGRTFEVTRGGEIVWSWSPPFAPNRPHRYPYDYTPQLVALSRSDGNPVRPEAGYRHVDRSLYGFGDSTDRFTRSLGGKKRNLLREGNLCRPLLLPEDAEATLSYGIDRKRARRAQVTGFKARFSVRLESELLPEGVELFEDTVSLEGDPWRHPVLSLKDHSYSKVTLCLGIEVSGESLERAGPLAFWAGPHVRSAAVAELPDAEESGVALSPEELEVRRQHLEALGYVD